MKVSLRSKCYVHSKNAAVADRIPANAKELNDNDGAELGLDPLPVGPGDTVGTWPMPGLLEDGPDVELLGVVGAAGTAGVEPGGEAAGAIPLLLLGARGAAGPPAAGAGAGAEEDEAGTLMASFCPMEQWPVTAQM